MIPRITRGGSGYGALSYDHGPGRRDEHRNAHKVGGNIAGRTWQQRSASMDDHVRRMHPKLTKPITRTSLRLAPEDRNLTDREWRAVAERYVQKMGYADGPWEAVRHADDHIHLTMSRVRWDGSVVDQWKDKTRAQSAVRDIEREHGLVDASSRYNRDVPQLSRNDVERSARASELTGRTIDPEKQQLRDRVAEAERFSGGTRAGFERELTARGISFRANESGPTERNPHGKMNGYSYRVDGHTDANGDPVWFKASHLGQRYGWAQTEQRLERLRTAPAAQGGATDGDDTPARHIAAEPEASVRDPQGHDGDTVVGGEKRAERERDGDERDNELVPERPEAEQATDRDASAQARDAERSGDDATARRDERIDTDRDKARADHSDRNAAARNDRDADRQDRSAQAAEQRSEDRRQKTEESRERSPEDDARQHEPDRPQHRSTAAEQRHRHEEATERPNHNRDNHAADDEPRHSEQRDTSRPERTGRDAETRDREPVATEVSKRAEERPEQQHPERVNEPARKDGDQRSQESDKEPDDAKRPANSKDRARERAHQWAQERRERSQTPQRDRSPGESIKPAQRDADPQRRQSDTPERHDSSVPARDHPGTTEESRRTGVVRSGKDDGHVDRRPDHNTSPDKPERREGERSMSDSEQRDGARDAKEAARERAEQWAADRKERSQDNERDRSAERDR